MTLGRRCLGRTLQEPEACPAKKPKLTPNQEAAILCIFFAAAMSRLLEGPTWKAFKKKSRIRTLRCPALSNWQLPCPLPSLQGFFVGVRCFANNDPRSFTVRPSADLKTLTNPSPIAVLLLSEHLAWLRGCLGASRLPGYRAWAHSTSVTLTRTVWQTTTPTLRK